VGTGNRGNTAKSIKKRKKRDLRGGKEVISNEGTPEGGYAGMGMCITSSVVSRSCTIRVSHIIQKQRTNYSGKEKKSQRDKRTMLGDKGGGKGKQRRRLVLEDRRPGPGGKPRLGAPSIHLLHRKSVLVTACQEKKGLVLFARITNTAGGESSRRRTRVAAVLGGYPCGGLRGRDAWESARKSGKI